MEPKALEQNSFANRKLADGVIVINPGRLLDNNNAHEMVAGIAEAQASGFRYIILDMAELEFISSAGVGSIIGTVESLREVGGDIVICNASPSILQVLELLDLSDYLTIRSNTNEAAAVCGVEA